MWALFAAGHGGTLKLLKDVTLSKAYALDGALADAAIDFNGHTITGSGITFTVSGNSASSPLVLKDSSGMITETSNRVDMGGKAEYNAAAKTYTYYKSIAVDGGLDNGLIPATDKTTADLSGMGGINAMTNELFVLSDGWISVESGAYRNDSGSIVSMSDGLSKFDLKDGFIYDSGSVVKNANGKYIRMSGGTVVGCESDVIFGLNDASSMELSFTGGVIANCNAGSVIDTRTATTKLTLDNMILCNNTVGERGVVWVGSGTTVEMKTSQMVCNTSGQSAGFVVKENTDKSISCTDSVFVANDFAKGCIAPGDFCTLLITIEGCNFVRNKAANGAAIFGAGGVTYRIKNTAITHNIAADKGGGIYLKSGNIYVGDNLYVHDNTDNDGADNIYLETGSLVTVWEDITRGRMGFTTAVEPTESNDVVIADNHLGIKRTRDIIFSDKGFFVKRHDVYVYLSVEEETRNMDCVTVQCYGYLDRIEHGASSEKKLNLINTMGGRLPTNDETPSVLPLYVNSDGNVVKTNQLVKIYNDVELDEGMFTATSIDVFQNENYDNYEVWIAKEDTALSSIDPTEWNIYPYTDDLSFELHNGDVVRIVYKPSIGSQDIDVVFYDYDISDGGWYLTEANAGNGVNQQPTEDQAARDKAKQVLWMQTSHSGINSASNHTNYKTGDARIAFGNGNMGVEWAQNEWNSPGGKVRPNVYNRATGGCIATFSGATYGIPSRLDADGNIVYSSGISAPKLFDDGYADGKTVYTDKAFRFARYGDTYTLSAVTGTGVQGLETFTHPGSYVNIWTNNFWPMDYASSYGTNDHDIKFGSSARTGDSGRRYKGHKAASVAAVSDDGLDHNAYFGFSAGITFSLPQGYTGPLEYYFFGDDDIWVFLDGRLICDVGGVHSAIGEYVNLWDYLSAGDTSEHHMSIYYTERGASGSTCWMQFTMPNIKSATELPVMLVGSFKKTDDSGRPLAGVAFTLYEDSACSKVIGTQVSDDDGTVTFTELLDGHVYYLRETQGLEGYIPNNAVYVMSQNTDREWFIYRLDDTKQMPVEAIINEEINMPMIPNTGSNELLEVLIFGSAMLALGFFVAIWGRLTRRDVEK